MPGLVGFAGAEGPESARSEQLRRLRQALTHQPFHVQDSLFVDARVCASRVHLGLIQREPQPLSRDGFRVWLDGELTNRHELRQRVDGVADSDAAILLGLLRPGLESGDHALLAKIDGIFAAVVYDETQRQLHFVSDRYGLRHLYTRVGESGILWSSEQKAFALFPERGRRIDSTAVREFLEVGHLLGSRSWFDDVQLLAPGTVESVDIDSRRVRCGQYWSWAAIRPALEPFDERELCEEISRRFRTAVRRRVAPGERVGVRLSGGLDSRAVLAAVPDEFSPLPVMSFGKPGCDDLRLASQAARVRGAEHHVALLGGEGWIEPRLECVWWTDGQLNLLHMHGVGMLEEERDLYDFHLSGFLGDVIAGGSYLELPGESETERIDGRGRRFVIQGPRSNQVFLEQRLPFMANDLVELLLSLPPELRRGSRLYHRVLLETFPEYFERIPWQSTGLAISKTGLSRGAARALRGLRRRGRRALARVGLPWDDPSHYADYQRWIREGSARALFEERLLARDAAVLEWYEPGEIEALWQAHLRGEDHSERLGRLLTLELFAQRLARESG